MMRAQFETWLGNYKGFKKQKTQNVLSILDGLSDEFLQKAIIDSSLFSNDGYIPFAKRRQIVYRSRDLSNGEKSALALLGDFFQLVECASIPLPNSTHSCLYDYCKEIRMSYSYKPVLLLVLLALEAWKTPSIIDDVVDRFSEFYRDRIKNGFVAEKENSLFSTDSFSRESAERVIIDNPISVLRKDGVVFFVEETSKIGITSKYSPAEGEQDSIKQLLLQRIEKYYSHLEKKPELASTEEVISLIHQLEESIKKTQQKKRIRESQDHIEAMLTIWNNTAHTITDPAENNTIRTNCEYIEEDDPRSVGKLVREQMTKLAQAGYVFDDDLFDRMCTLEWSKKTLKLYYPLFKIVHPSDDISLLKRDYLGNNRYWKQVFPFKNGEVLITSEWYKESKALFIAWFNSLIYMK